jgi:CheY-like chemotaxis protein
MPKILIIDDIDILRKDLRRVVDEVFYGWDIFEASDYPIAMQILDKNKFDIVISDLKLREAKNDEFEGLLIAQQVKKINVLSEVLVVTSHLDEKSTSLALSRCGVDIKLLDRGQPTFLQNLHVHLKIIDNKMRASLNVADFWKQVLESHCKVSYWILFMNGFDMKIDRNIAGEILVWQAAMSKYEAAFYPFQLPDSGFTALCNQS